MIPKEGTYYAKHKEERKAYARTYHREKFSDPKLREERRVYNKLWRRQHRSAAVVLRKELFRPIVPKKQEDKVYVAEIIEGGLVMDFFGGFRADIK